MLLLLHQSFNSGRRSRCVLGRLSLGIAPNASAEGRARNAGLNAGVKQLFAASQNVVESTLTSLGTTDPAPFHMDAMTELPDRFLQACPAGVEYPRSDAPAGLRHIGTLRAKPVTTADPPAWWPDVVAAERVVVLTQGTVANRDLSELIDGSYRLHARRLQEEDASLDAFDEIARTIEELSNGL